MVKNISLAMDKTFLLQDITGNELRGLGETPGRLRFPLERYGYATENVLNNGNRHHIKLVCSIRKHGDLRRLVSTTYARHNDYLRLVETTTCLKCNDRLSPEIVELYSRENTVVCGHIGEFLSEYLANNPDRTETCLRAVFEYMKEVNFINQRMDKFSIPSIVRISIALSGESGYHFDFLPECRPFLSRLEEKGVNFLYGCGVEDPHIWNYRIVDHKKKTRALTTDFDYFSDGINSFWELGYFYATFRWLKKTCSPVRRKAESVLLPLVKDTDLKSEFMFWLGVLSSYCGYRDSICGLLGGLHEPNEELEKQYKTISRLDKKIAVIAEKLL